MADIKKIRIADDSQAGYTEYDIKDTTARTTAASKSTVSVSTTGSTGNEVNYITVDGTEYKLAGGGAPSAYLTDATVSEDNKTLTITKHSGGNVVFTPPVPTKTSQLTNDSGFLTEHQSLTNYYTKTETDGAISTATEDMATQTWVGQQGYLTEHQSLANYDTKTEVNTKISNATSDMATQTWVGQQGYLTEHQSLANYSTTSQMNTAISNHHDSTKENTSNKVTSWSTTTTDAHYPSEALVKNSIDNVREVAEGKTKNYVCSDVTNPILNTQDATITLTSDLTDINGNTIAITDLKLGDNIYVIETDVPDRWYQGNNVLNKLETSKVPITSISKNGIAITPENNNVNITVPTKTSDIENDSGFLTSHQDISGKLDKSGGTMTGDLTVGSSSIQTNGYIKGTWLYTSQASDLGSAPAEYPVLGSGWLYKRTLAETKSDLGINEKADLSGATFTGQVTFNSPDIHNSSTTWFNCDPNFSSSYCYGMYQWDNMFQFTKRNLSNVYLNEAWHIELDTEKLAFNYPTTFASNVAVSGTLSTGGVDVQKKLIAGTNITIADDGRTISATGGGGSEPSAYLKSASASGNTLTLTNKDNTTVTYTPTTINGLTGGNVTGQTNITKNESGAANQSNVMKVLSTETAATEGSNWRGRMLVGAEDLTFLLGTYNGLAGLGCHGWTSAAAETGASWKPIYIQPDGTEPVYIGASGGGWTGGQGTLKVTGSNTSGGGSVDVSGTLRVNGSSVLTSHQDISGKVSKTGDTMSGALTINGPTTAGFTVATGGAKISGRYQNSGDDEGLIIGPASNGYAGLILGAPSGERTILYHNINTHSACIRRHNGSSQVDIQIPHTAGTFALTSQIPTYTSQLTNNSGFLTSHQDISGKANLSGANFTGPVTYNSKPFAYVISFDSTTGTLNLGS